MKKVTLLTGITGQDGSFLAGFLMEKGYEVHGILRRFSSFNTVRIEHLYLDEWVRVFATLAFKEAGIELRWEGEGALEKGVDVKTNQVLVEVDPKYFRPCEVEQLLGDPTKARTLLGWNPTKISFSELVKIMMEHDMKFVKKLHLKSLMD